MNYIAYCTKGLEEIVEREITSTCSPVTIAELGDKRVIFETQKNFKELIKLKTVDDIGLAITKIEDISSVAQIQNALRELNLMELKNLLSTNRPLDNNFSITASITGNEIKPNQLITTIAECIEQKYNWKFMERDHTNFDIRIFLDHQTCYISIRLTKESLHHRAYKTISRIGSLRPTVAAAMVLLATQDKIALKIVDNFCGSGTILCEAVGMKNEVFGGDIEAESVNITRANLTNLNFTKIDNIKLLDATKTSWSSGCFDAAISNLPWNKQIEITSITDLYIGTLKEYKRILKPSGALCLLLTKPELLIKHAKKIFPGSKIEVYKIGLLGQNPTIVVIRQ